jgi:hypothetical protein
LIGAVAASVIAYFFVRGIPHFDAVRPEQPFLHDRTTNLIGVAVTDSLSGAPRFQLKQQVVSTGQRNTLIVN